MKLIISLVLYLIYSQTTYAGMIRIYYENQKDINLAIHTQKRIIEKFNIPYSLIQIENKKCKSRDHRFYELCINEKRELIELPNLNKSKILKSFIVFKTKEIL